MVHGVLPIDKPAGMTSARAVSRVKRLLPRRTKVGHAGTLDPFATGLLLLLIGKATKSCEQVMDQPKTYEATVKLGATTETDDPESAEQPSAEARTISGDKLQAALAAFIGPISQVPPRYSAIKLGGRRACDRVRDGQIVALKARTVHVYSIDLLSYAWPIACLRIECGRGTYIRSIARDLGASLGVGGYLTQLRRTRIGEFDVASAPALDALTQDSLVKRVIPQPRV